MRKLIAILLVSSIPSFGAFGAKTQWDVQTTGADTNGAGFDAGVASPGTDESTGAGTAITVTLASGTTGTCSPACTSTTHGPGNFIYIASGAGCTTSTRYEILSQAAGTITVDKTMGSAANVCVGTIGGPAVTYCSLIQTEVEGNAIWIKSGTYNQTTTCTVPAGNRTSPRLIGYGTTHGDNGTRPLITTATNSTVLFQTGNASGVGLFANNIAFSNTAGTRASAIQSEGAPFFISFINCTFDGFNRAIDLSVGGVVSFTFYNSAAINDQGSAIYLVHTSGGSIVNSYLYGNMNGVETAASSGTDTLQISGSILSGNSTNGVLIDNTTSVRLIVSDSTISGNTSNGIGFTGTTTNAYLSQIILQGSILYGNGGYGLQMPTTTLPFNYTVGHNAWGGNNGGGTGLNYPSQVSAGTGDVALSSTPFTNSAGQDFSLNSTVGGGAGLKGTGIPGAFPAGSTTGYHDIGAVTGAAPGTSGIAGAAFVQ